MADNNLKYQVSNAIKTIQSAFDLDVESMIRKKKKDLEIESY
jgi:hypothetical protein